MSQSMPEIKRKYVVPGELIAEGQYRAESNVIKDGEKFYSTRVGMAEMGRDGVRVIPLSGAYFPRLDDMVVGNIVDHSAFAWEVDINSPFFAVLPAACDSRPPSRIFRVSKGRILAAGRLILQRQDTGVRTNSIFRPSNGDLRQTHEIVHKH